MKNNILTSGGLSKKYRDISIDIINFVAVLLIINSHADICYPKFKLLATGGAIGDALFLFCSGYTLFWSPVKRFDNYYKRRINRIYPSVFACIILQIIMGFDSWDNMSWFKLAGGGGDFVVAIMVYYVLLYAVQKWFINHIPSVVAVTAVATLVAYWFFPYKYEVSNRGLYGTLTAFRWIPYFGMMLMGAYTGLKAKDSNGVKSSYKDVIMMVGSLVMFYGIQIAAKKYSVVAPFQIATIPFLASIVYYFWKCCNAEGIKKIYGNKTGNLIIMTVGGLCLESYLIQFSFFTDKYNWLFPLNIPLLMVAILFAAYVTRCIARVFSQTFRSEEYEWRKVFAI